MKKITYLHIFFIWKYFGHLVECFNLIIRVVFLPLHVAMQNIRKLYNSRYVLKPEVVKGRFKTENMGIYPTIKQTAVKCGESRQIGQSIVSRRS